MIPSGQPHANFYALFVLDLHHILEKVHAPPIVGRAHGLKNHVADA
jgi:hypothetical protein